MREMPSVVDAKGTSFYLILNPAAGSAVGWPRTSWVLDDQARWRGRTRSSTVYFHRAPGFAFFGLLTEEASNVRLTLNKVGESLELLN